MKKIPAIAAVLYLALWVSGCMTTVDMAVITRESGWKGRLGEDQAVELAQKHLGPAKGLKASSGNWQHPYAVSLKRITVTHGGLFVESHADARVGISWVRLVKIKPAVGQGRFRLALVEGEPRPHNITLKGRLERSELAELCCAIEVLTRKPN